MIILIGGTTHSGKTLLAQNLLEIYQMPYLSIDHLKMGLIKSGSTDLTPEDDAGLTEYLWPIVRSIIVTALENKQNLIVVGCYIPCDWKLSFSSALLESIVYTSIILSEEYIDNDFDTILEYENCIEARQYDAIDRDGLILENQMCYEENIRFGNDNILVTDTYNVIAQFQAKYHQCIKSLMSE
ncbi:adenylate kinase [Erysipelothrix rhusiopathiae]|uniref:adenylate kinase n=1 Tax=Erysipelothrix rhusiopathiae TaxID=1648 RepID=UPI003D353D60